MLNTHKIFLSLIFIMAAAPQSYAEKGKENNDSTTVRVSERSGLTIRTNEDGYRVALIKGNTGFKEKELKYDYESYMKSVHNKVFRTLNSILPSSVFLVGEQTKILVNVAINAGGELKSVKIQSNIADHNDSIKETLYFAAPYPRFSESIKEEVDMLIIAGTYVFNKHTASGKNKKSNNFNIKQGRKEPVGRIDYKRSIEWD